MHLETAHINPALQEWFKIFHGHFSCSITWYRGEYLESIFVHEIKAKTVRAWRFNEIHKSRFDSHIDAGQFLIYALAHSMAAETEEEICTKMELILCKVSQQIQRRQEKFLSVVRQFVVSIKALYTSMHHLAEKQTQPKPDSVLSCFVFHPLALMLHVRFNFNTSSNQRMPGSFVRSSVRSRALFKSISSKRDSVDERLKM